MSNSQTSHITPIQNIAFTQIDEDIVLMGPENGQFYGLNCLGADIWNLISKKAYTIKELCEHIMQHYEIEEAQCVSDVNQFIQKMQEEGFISLTECRNQ